MATLRWSHVKVSVDLSNACSRSKKKDIKRIIGGSTGVIRPGQILAVIGPSGAGKTTLFNVLAKRTKDLIVTGQLTLNGKSYDTEVLKAISGFVWQGNIDEYL